jgi:hypothetical protein
MANKRLEATLRSAADARHRAMGLNPSRVSEVYDVITRDPNDLFERGSKRRAPLKTTMVWAGSVRPALRAGHQPTGADTALRLCPVPVFASVRAYPPARGLPFSPRDRR